MRLASETSQSMPRPEVPQCRAWAESEGFEHRDGFGKIGGEARGDMGVAAEAQLPDALSNNRFLLTCS